MSKHTPGPWIMNGNYPETQAVIYDEATGTNIAVVYQGDEANARLIAAAPDLLQAAQLTLAILENLTTEEFSQGGDKVFRDALIEAVAKAEPTP